MSNLWATPEANSWARDFSYAEYKNWCNSYQSQPLCKEAYLAICKALDTQLEHDNSKAENITTKADIVESLS